MDNEYDFSGPLCKKCGSESSSQQSFCSRCGSQLPLPPNIEALWDREFSAILNLLEHDCTHESQKSVGHQFCVVCGKKL